MKALLVSDIHMNLEQLRWVEQQASSYDLVIIAGDLLQLAYTTEKSEQIATLLPILKRIRDHASLAVVSGNHDLDSLTSEGEEYAQWIRQLAASLIVSDGTGGETDHLRITPCPWWNGPEIRREMLDAIADDKVSSEQQWLWIHHAPPRGSKIAQTSRGDAGDPFLLKLIGKYRPDFVVSGHIHNAPFLTKGSWYEKIDSTWVFNPGKQPGSIPTYINLDLDNREATFISFEEKETISLA